MNKLFESKLVKLMTMGINALIDTFEQFICLFEKMDGGSTRPYLYVCFNKEDRGNS